MGKKRTNKKRKRDIFKKILVVLIIILVILAGMAFALVQNKLGKLDFFNLNNEELGIENDVKGYRNIALFAVDTRNVDSNSGARSDGIIVVSINEKTKDVKLTSVYRDTYVQVEGHGLTKITHAYSYGGPTLAINTLNTNLDLDISEFVTVNFQSVADAIDLMGGIDVEVKSDEVAQINKYIKETSKITGIKSNSLVGSGMKNLDGVQAVAYGRIRKTTGGDYRRTERMRTVISKALDKAKTMDIATLNKIIDKVLPEVQTNISSGEIIKLASKVASYNITESIGWPYDTKGKTIDRWYGVPVTLETNVVQLHKKVFEQEDYVASDTIKEISNKIIKKTGYTEGTEPD